jgi:hypothetical protein
MKQFRVLLGGATLSLRLAPWGSPILAQSDVTTDTPVLGQPSVQTVQQMKANQSSAPSSSVPEQTGTPPSNPNVPSNSARLLRSPT